MEFIINNWFMFVVLVAMIVMAVMAVKKYAQLPTEEQIKNVKEWLLYAVTLAEKEFSDSGMGKIKLRAVYQEFLVKFPWLAKVITFEQFSQMVDEALEEMKHLLESNKNIQIFVGK